MGLVEGELTIERNVVLLPEGGSKATFMRWSQLIADQYPTYFTLNPSNKLPHLSVYIGRYPARNEPLILDRVGEIVREQHLVVVSFPGQFSVYNGFIFYDAAVAENPDLTALHQRLVTALNPLREGLIPDVIKTLKNLPTSQQQALKKYGTPSALETYFPHITITRLINESQAEEAIKLLPNEPMTISFNSLSYTLFTEHGTCPRVLESFPFQR